MKTLQDKSKANVITKTKKKAAKPSNKNPESYKGHHKQLGYKGESLACEYLKKEGLDIIERNWRCKMGEADIIAKEGSDLVFIEVKTRSSTFNGFPEEAITAQKRRKYENIALSYLTSHSLPSARVRFDVISIVVIDDAQAFLKHHRDAFCAGD